MKLYIFALLTTLVISLAVCGQDIEATTKDGKKVILKSDKTWDFVVDAPKKEGAAQTKDAFVVDDYKEVVKFTESIKKEIEKSEFETESEYAARIAKLVEEKQFNGKPIAQVSYEIKPLIFNYSAETQSFGMTILSDSRIRLVDRKYGSYTTALFEKSFKMSPEKAKELKPSMEIIILGFPVDSSVLGLQVVPTQIIVRNKNSGEIYLNDAVDNFLAKTVSSDRETDSSPRISEPTSSGGEVHVNGYYRKDGTYVKPYTRRAPRKKN